MNSQGKFIIILAGPNGAGKTTFAREYLSLEAGIIHFINADLIAAGLSPLKPEAVAIRAGKLMLELMDEHASRGERFAFETTLSGRSYCERIRVWRALGYSIRLIFLKLPDVNLALKRVHLRVTQGGHDVPAADIRRRFIAGIRNFGSSGF